MFASLSTGFAQEFTGQSRQHRAPCSPVEGEQAGGELRPFNGSCHFLGHTESAFPIMCDLFFFLGTRCHVLEPGTYVMPLFDV